MLLLNTVSMEEQASVTRPIEVITAEPAVVIPTMPFYSQFDDITSTKWKKVGCGVASLAMLIEYYEPETVSVDKLLGQAIASGAYLNNAGWTHKGLISLSRRYGLDGKSYDLYALEKQAAFKKLEDSLKDGPVMASVHYKFEPSNPIPHLVVINGIKDGVVYYNDPASDGGNKQLSTSKFLKAWKKKFIVIRPA
jgi:ABC-type bacteriocin/lantibiotic exporter with double-glycine peptidase domain